MKVEDLMVGDRVRVPSEINRIMRIRNTFDLDSAVLYEPISLTPEILEKNGFVPTKGESIFNEIGCTIIYGKYERLDEDKMLNIGDNLWPIKYVHQLQHALKLCGIDKKIIL